jgi:hypothetical protein|tara:strand:+ start:923 stop:1132 length:210 start_codon:yes stop_codon:yes gene_type:complete
MTEFETGLIEAHRLNFHKFINEVEQLSYTLEHSETFDQINVVMSGHSRLECDCKVIAKYPMFRIIGYSS